MKMKIITLPPQLIEKRKQCVRRVIAKFKDGKIHFADYYSLTRAEAMRKYLMEFGPVIGEMYVEILDK
jgi:hypothetical protein